MFRTSIAAYWLFILFLAQTASPSEPVQSRFEVSATKFLLGTTVDITALHSNIKECEKGCYYAFQEIERIERLLSCHKKDSDISKINGQAGLAPVRVSHETFSILQRAVAYSQKFQGLFDITIGPVTELWGFNSQAEKAITIPAKEQLAALLDLVDFNKVTLNGRDSTVFLPTQGMKLDLGGIAKGYAIDRAAAVLRQQGIQNFLINAGGDIFASGRKSAHKRWTIGVQHPRKPDALLATFELSDSAVATSGDYERYADIGGRRYHHILHPKTGYPAGLSQSVTVFAPSAEEADVWATYLFIIGYDKYQENRKEWSLNAIFVKAGGDTNYDLSSDRDFALHVLH